MLDILDSVRKSRALQSETKLNIKNSNEVNKAIALYKRVTGEVCHTEQLLLDQNYVNAIQAVAKTPEVDNKRIGTLINIYV